MRVPVKIINRKRGGIKQHKAKVTVRKQENGSNREKLSLVMSIIAMSSRRNELRRQGRTITGKMCGIKQHKVSVAGRKKLGRGRSTT